MYDISLNKKKEHITIPSKHFINKNNFFFLYDNDLNTTYSITCSGHIRDKIDVINIVTAPEIEILVILNEGKYQEFKKSKMKPSDFCKQVLKMPHVKNYNFVYNYFSDANILVSVLKLYKKLPNTPDGELSLIDLLFNK